jgi:predicted TIM-barrel fold metal-dependent hydrolase
MILTRRRALIGLGALASGALPILKPRNADALVPQIPVDFQVPRSACDCHVHVVGDPDKFPMSPRRDYTPPPAAVSQLRHMLRILGLDRVVIVTPTIYDDNAATLDAIRQLGQDRARGIALINEGTSFFALESLARSGIVGIRLLFFGGQNFKQEKAVRHLQAFINLAQPRKWHLDIEAPPEVIAALAEPLAASPVPIVLDYFGWLAAGVQQQGYDAVASLVRSGRGYVKLSEPYRLSRKGPDYPDLAQVARALVAVNPDRILWGSGWPHVDSGSDNASVTLTPNLPVDSGHLLNLLAEWVPDAAIRHKILVDNPAELYRF